MVVKSYETLIPIINGIRGPNHDPDSGDSV